MNVFMKAGDDVEIRLATINDVDEMFDMFFNYYERAKLKYDELPMCDSWRDSIYEKLKELINDNPAVVVMKDGNMIGYLSGYCPISNYRGSQKGVCTPDWGHCVEYIDKAKIYDLMLSKIWTYWLDKRCYNHSISYLMDDEVENYFFDMTYGSIVEDGIISLDNLSSKKIVISNDIIIREANKGDTETLLAFVTLLINKLNGKPIFRYGTPSTIEEVEYEFFEKEGICLVAEKNNTVIACMRGHFGTTTNSDLVCNNTNIAIDYAYVIEEYRGKSIAKKLLEEMLVKSKEDGMKTCTVDYETHNYNAKVFWRKHFRIFTKSLLRKVDDRF